MTTEQIEAITTAVGRLSDLDAKCIVESLTKPGSEFQREVQSKHGSDTQIALVRFGSWRIVAWAATHDWRAMQTLEGFTLDQHRRRGFARLAASALVASGAINPARRIAVFAPHCIDIAKSVGCRDIRLYEYRDGDWFENS